MSSLKSFSQKICFTGSRKQQLTLVKQRRSSRFTFVKTSISNSQIVVRAKFQGSDRLFCFISICKFSSVKNSFETITSLSEFHFRCRLFILLVQTKAMVALPAAKNLWHEWELTWYLRWRICTLITSWTHSTLLAYSSMEYLSNEDRPS